jgi:hypothetical protein
VGILVTYKSEYTKFWSKFILNCYVVDIIEQKKADFDGRLFSIYFSLSFSYDLSIMGIG